MKPHHLLATVFAVGGVLAASQAGAQAAEALAHEGARATLSVEYRYVSTGKKQDKYDLKEWRAHRTVKLQADLAAQKPTALPTMQALDAKQTAELNSKRDKGQAAAAQMAPMMAGVEKIMAKCGEDEACISRESQKMGFGLSGTPEMAAAQQAGKDVKDIGNMGAMRYQAWRATAQKGSYSIDEKVHIVHADPICVNLPRARCTRDTVRQGGGEVPPPPGAAKAQGLSAGLAAVEVDAAKNTLTLALPLPANALPYAETITTDEPPGTRETPTPKGPQQKLHVFRVADSAKSAGDKPLIVPLKGGWRSQSGEQVRTFSGEGVDAGKLTVRWRFVVQ